MSAPPPHPPLLVLGCHRSGTSAVTGLLDRAAGLHLGEVLPASEANPVGYFESAPVVVAHNHIFSALDRDWTCPPPSFDPDDVPRAILREQVESLAAAGQPWGVKDPRLLFTLPAWVDLAEEFRFVGVIRTPADIVRSIARRDQIPEEAVGRIVEVYLERLAALHRTLGFPIVDFSAPPAEVVERVRQIAGLLGLPWNEAAAGDFLKPSLIHHSSSHPDPDANLRYLSAAAAEPITAVGKVAAVELRHALEGLDPRVTAGVNLNVGPRFSERRRELWKLFSNGDEIDRVVELIPPGTPPRNIRPLDVDYEAVTVASAHDIARRLSRMRAPSHLLGPGLLEATAPDKLDDVLRDAASFTQSFAVVALDGFVTATPTDSMTWERGLFVTSQTMAPFHQSLDELEAAASRSGWRSTLDTPDRHGRTTFILFKEADLKLDELPDGGRMAFLSLEARLAALERDMERARRSEGPERHSVPAQQSDDRLAAELDRTKAALERMTDQYERLRNRRIVKMALRIADMAKPVVGRVRR